MPRFSENLKQLEELENRYRQELDDYQRAVTTYRTLLEHNPKDPGLPALYAQVDAKNKQVQGTYVDLEELRRTLYPGSGASSSLA